MSSIANPQNQVQVPITFNMGDEKDFDRIFRDHYATLCSFANHYLKDNDDAEEVVESVFLKLWNDKEGFHDEQHTRAFLYRAVYNRALNLIKTNKRLSQREQAYGLEMGFVEESYLNNILRAELIAIIYREIENLPVHYAQVMKLSYQEGLKNEEIAKQLGLSIQTVKNYKNKSTGILKSRLPKEAWLILHATIAIQYLS